MLIATSFRSAAPKKALTVVRRCTEAFERRRVFSIDDRGFGCSNMMLAQTRSAFIARQNRYTPFRIML